MGRAAHLGGMRGLLIVNPLSGSGDQDTGALEREASRRGIAVHVLAPGEDPQAVARAAETAVGIAGGDGSLGAVAEIALERDLPFVCVPLGTRNHFARDVGLDRNDPSAALAAFDSGRERRIDVGRVGGQVFVNNVSFGLYARLVRRREAHRRRSTAFAGLRAAWLSARDRSPEPWVVDGAQVAARILLVANNAYDVDLFELGARERLDEGKLHAYLATGLLPRTWEEHVAEKFVVERAGGGLLAAVDGDPIELDSPVELSVEPRALRILLP
jgi:diacylglycerol kinase family enzyme